MYYICFTQNQPLLEAGLYINNNNNFSILNIYQIIKFACLSKNFSCFMHVDFPVDPCFYIRTVNDVFCCYQANMIIASGDPLYLNNIETYEKLKNYGFDISQTNLLLISYCIENNYYDLTYYLFSKIRVINTQQINSIIQEIANHNQNHCNLYLELLTNFEKNNLKLKKYNHELIIDSVLCDKNEGLYTLLRLINKSRNNKLTKIFVSYCIKKYENDRNFAIHRLILSTLGSKSLHCHDINAILDVIIKNYDLPKLLSIRKTFRIPYYISIPNVFIKAYEEGYYSSSYILRESINILPYQDYQILESYFLKNKK